MRWTFRLRKKGCWEVWQRGPLEEPIFNRHVHWVNRGENAEREFPFRVRDREVTPSSCWYSTETKHLSLVAINTNICSTCRPIIWRVHREKKLLLWLIFHSKSLEIGLFHCCSSSINSNRESIHYSSHSRFPVNSRENSLRDLLQIGSRGKGAGSGGKSFSSVATSQCQHEVKPSDQRFGCFGKETKLVASDVDAFSFSVGEKTMATNGLHETRQTTCVRRHPLCRRNNSK